MCAKPAVADDKRPMPDYDGRGNVNQDDGSWALWIPRIALAPLYVVNEYVLRRPIGALIRVSERQRWTQRVTNLFTFGADDNYFLAPTALFDFGLRPTIGIYFRGDHVFAQMNSMRVQVATGGTDWNSITAVDRYGWNDGRTVLQGRFELLRRPDLLFFGIGPSVTDRTRARYGIQRIDAGPTFKQLFGPSSISVMTGARRIAFRTGCCTDPTLNELVTSGVVDMPPGFEVPYTALYQRAILVLDSRKPAPAPGSGAYLQLNGESAFDVTNDRSWVTYGGVLGAAADVTGHQRVVKLQVGLEFVDPIHGGIVPFNELAQLGSDQMPGFVGGWMNGRSTFVSGLSYTWPVAIALDGETRFSVGNAFGEHLEGMTTRKFRLSGDIGIKTSGSRDAGFEVILGLGTETIEDGAHITSVRIAFGSRKGF